MKLETLKNCYRLGLEEYFNNLDEPKHVIERIARGNKEIDNDITEKEKELSNGSSKTVGEFRYIIKNKINKQL